MMFSDKLLEPMKGWHYTRKFSVLPGSFIGTDITQTLSKTLLKL